MPIKFSKEGKDISSSTPDDFLINSLYPLLKVAAYGTFQTSTDGVATITHNLGYKPFAIVTSQMVTVNDSWQTILDTNYYQHDWTLNLASTGIVDLYGITQVTTTQLLISVGQKNVHPLPQCYGFYYIFSSEI
jgi:hypothetical protein